MKTMVMVGLVWLLGAATTAAAGISSGAGTVGGQGISLGSSARSLAMGGAGVAAIKEPAAIWINPAQIVRLKTPGMSFMHGVWLEDVALDQFAVGLPIPVGFVGGALTLVRVQDIQSFDASGNPAGTITPSDLSLTAAYALSVGKVAVGLAGTYFRSELADDARATAFAGDVGASVRPVPELTISVSALHMGSTLKFDAQKAQLPMTIRGGAAYAVPAYGVTAAADVVKPLKNEVSVHLGLEERVTLHRDVSLNVRGGWRSRAPTGRLSGVAAGGGLLWHPVHGFADRGGEEDAGQGKSYFVSAVRVDYAWTPMGELGEAHWFSFGLVF